MPQFTMWGPGSDGLMIMLERAALPSRHVARRTQRGVCAVLQIKWYKAEELYDILALASKVVRCLVGLCLSICSTIYMMAANILLY
jgi:hypothetical protein